MAIVLVVEDGTGKEDANTYASLEEFRSYFAERGDGEAVSATDDDIAAGLVLAKDYMEQRFTYRGTKAVTIENGWDHDSALEFPRYSLPNSAWDFDDDTETSVIPPNLKKAQIEYANRARPSLAAPLAPDQVFNDAGVVMNIVKDKVGPIETEYQPLGGYSATASVIRPYPKADMYLKDLIYSEQGRVIHA